MCRLLYRALVVFWFALSAQAAPLELTASTEGQGSLQRGGAVDQTSRVNLILKRDGSFNLSLVGDVFTKFAGTWRPDDRNSISLTVRTLGDKDATGRGQVDLRSVRGGADEILRLTLGGETEKGQSFRARFIAAGGPIIDPGPRPPVPGPAAILDSRRAGAGKLRVDSRETYPIALVTVRLLDNGRATVRTDNPTKLLYEGNWVRSGNGSATLSVRGGLNGEKVDGAVSFSNGRFKRVELSGTTGRRYYSIDFVPFN